MEQLAVAYEAATTTSEERELRKRGAPAPNVNNRLHFETPESHPRAQKTTFPSPHLTVNGIV